MKDRLLTRNFLVMLPIGFSFAVNFLIIYVTMSQYAHDMFGVSATLSGLAASIFIFGSFASRMFMARFMDIIGMKRILVVFSAVGFFIYLLYPIITGYWELLVIRFAHGCIYGMCLLTSNTLIARIVPCSRRGEGIGYYMLAYTVASAIGPFLSMVLVRSGGFNTVFLLGAAMYLVSGGFALLLKMPRESVSEQQRLEARKLTLNNMFERSAMRISLVAMIFFFAYSSVITFISQYGTSVGLVEATTYFFLVMAVSTFLSRVFIGRVFDIYGENVVMVPCFIMFVAGVLIISFVGSGLQLLFAAFLIGFGVALVNSTGQSIVVRDTEPGRYSVALSTFSMSMDLSYAIGPFVMGFFATLVGYSGMYQIAAGIGTVGLVVYILIHGLGAGKLNKSCKN